MIPQFKRFLSLLLVILVLISSLTVPAYAVDEVYTVSDDASAFPMVYYTDGYTPGMYAGVDRSASFFASDRVSYGSYSSFGYDPTGFDDPTSGGLRQWSLSDYSPVITETGNAVNATTTIPNTFFLEGSMLTVRIPSTQDAYFDFQSSNILFDQTSPSADTFNLNGTLTFKLINLWSFVSGSSDYDDVSYYRASDPLAVQLLINGKPYGDIVDVTTYTSPFTGANVGTPAFATVSFDNLKVYYQGDTPELIGFRIYTGSAYGQSSHTYGDYLMLTLQNLISFQWTQQPDIFFVQEGGDGYAGDLSGISGLLSDISGKLSNIQTQLASGLNPVYTQLNNIVSRLNGVVGWSYLKGNGTIGQLDVNMTLSGLVTNGFLGLRALLVDNSGTSMLSLTVDNLASIYYQLVDSSGLSWLDKLYSLQDSAQSYVADTVFPWQSYNMETHQLNAATDVTGQNNLFFTAFQSIEDKLGRLAYVFGSDEDLALKDDADPGTDAFRENFGGGASLSQISEGADVVEGIDGLFDSGYDFGDAFTEISGESMFTMWFSAENAAAVDSTGSVMALDDSDPYNMQIYYDRLQEVAEKRDWGSD